MTVYIPVFYLGRRRNGLRHTGVQDHLEVLQDTQAPLEKVMLVLNAEEKRDILEFSELVKRFKPYYTKLSVLIRQNADYSYGGWNAAVDRCLKDGMESDFFLTEDDYIPTSSKFLEPFYSEMTSGVGYVACKLLDTHDHRHAAHSVGLLNGMAASDSVGVYGTSLKIRVGSRTYHDGEYNQIHFLDNITDLGWDMVDISKHNSVPFELPVPGTYWELGNPSGFAPIIPVGYNG